MCFLGLLCALTIKIKSISEKLHALSNVHEAVCSPCPRHIVKLNSSDVAQPVFQAFFYLFPESFCSQKRSSFSLGALTFVKFKYIKEETKGNAKV